MNGRRARTYTKRDIIRKVALASGERVNASAKWTERVFTAVREIMMSANPGLRIEIRDFGVFEVKPTKSKPKARNLKLREVLFVPTHRMSHFKPGKLLKSFLSQPLEGRIPSNN